MWYEERRVLKNLHQVCNRAKAYLKSQLNFLWPAQLLTSFKNQPVFVCFPCICVFVENIIFLRGFTLVSIRNSLKLVYSEKATKFWEISTVDLCHLQNFVAFWEYLPTFENGLGNEDYKVRCKLKWQIYHSNFKSWF